MIRSTHTYGYTGDSRNDRKRVGSFASVAVNIKKLSADHILAECPELLKLTLSDRWEC